MQRKSTIAEPKDVPCLIGLLIIVLALGLFGADAPAASLVISSLAFLTLAVSLLCLEDFRLEWWTVPVLTAWALLFGSHLIIGRAADGEHEYLMLLAGGCMFWIGRYGALSRMRRHRLFKWIAVFAFLFGMFAFFQHMIAPKYVLGIEKQYHVSRLVGPFLSSNTTATFLGMLLMFLMYRLLRTLQTGEMRSRNQNMPGAISWFIAIPVTLSGVLVTLTCLLLTASRAGFFAAGLALVILLLGFAFGQSGQKRDQKSKRHSPVLLILLIIIIALISVWSLSGALLETRLYTLDNDFAARQIMFDRSWTAGELAPVFGHGLNSLDYATAMTSTSDTNRYIITQNASHNVFAQWFMQAGWFGLIGLCALISLLIFVTIADSQNRLIKSLRLALIILVTAHGVFDYALEIPAVFLFFSLLIGLTSDRKRRRKRV